MSAYSSRQQMLSQCSSTAVLAGQRVAQASQARSSAGQAEPQNHNKWFPQYQATQAENISRQISCPASWAESCSGKPGQLCRWASWALSLFLTAADAISVQFRCRAMTSAEPPLNTLIKFYLFQASFPKRRTSQSSNNLLRFQLASRRVRKSARLQLLRWHLVLKLHQQKGRKVKEWSLLRSQKEKVCLYFKYEWERLVRLQLDNEQNVALIPEFFRAL
jgi:hypothetical protein